MVRRCPRTLVVHRIQRNEKETNVKTHSGLITIGDADEVILGIAMLGVDPDGSDFPEWFEFASDTTEDTAE